MPGQFIFLYAHSWTVYQCTLNVLIFHSVSYTLIVLTLFPHTFQFTSRTMCLIQEEAHVAEAWYMPECFHWQWENNDQNVFIGWYSMVYLSYTVCVFCFPRSWWGWLAGVFMKSLCNINMKIQSCWLINLVFFFVVGLYSLPLPKCISLCFHYCYVWCSKLSLGAQPA